MVTYLKWPELVIIIRHVLNTIVTQHGYTGQAGIPATTIAFSSNRPALPLENHWGTWVCLHQKGVTNTNVWRKNSVQFFYKQFVCQLCANDQKCVGKVIRTPLLNKFVALTVCECLHRPEDTLTAIYSLFRFKCLSLNIRLGVNRPPPAD